MLITSPAPQINFGPAGYGTHCPKSNPNFRDITRNVEENEILYEIFRELSRFPRYVSCYISENRLSLGHSALFYVNAAHLF